MSQSSTSIGQPDYNRFRPADHLDSVNKLKAESTPQQVRVWYLKLGLAVERVDNITAFLKQQFYLVQGTPHDPATKAFIVPPVKSVESKTSATETTTPGKGKKGSIKSSNSFEVLIDHEMEDKEGKHANVIDLTTDPTPSHSLELINFSRFLFQLLIYTVDYSVLQHMDHLMTSYPLARGLELLSAIKKLFNLHHAQTPAQLRDELNRLSQDQGEIISSYWSRMKSIADLLKQATLKELKAHTNSSLLIESWSKTSISGLIDPAYNVLMFVLDDEMKSHLLRTILPPYRNYADTLILSRSNTNLARLSAQDLVNELEEFERMAKSNPYKYSQDDQHALFTNRPSANKSSGNAQNETKDNSRGSKKNSKLSQSQSHSDSASNDSSHSNPARSQSKSSKPKCSFCEMAGHIAEKCFTNPANPENKLPEHIRRILNDSIKSKSLSRVNKNNHSNSAAFNASQNTRSQNFNEVQNQSHTQTQLPLIHPSTLTQCTRCDDDRIHCEDLCPSRDCFANLAFISSAAGRLVALNTSVAVRTSRSLTDYVYAFADTGASDHFFYSPSFFVKGSLRKLTSPINVHVASDAQQRIEYVGTVMFTTNNGIIMELKNCFLAPTFKVNLISINKLLRGGIKALFEEHQVTIVNPKTNKQITAPSVNGLYKIQMILPQTKPIQTTAVQPIRAMMADIGLKAEESTYTSVRDSAPVAASAIPASVELWHSRLAHQASSSIQKLVETNKSAAPAVLGLDLKSCHTSHGGLTNACAQCSVCSLSKATRAPFSNHSSAPAILAPLDRVSCDLSGPVSSSLTDGSLIRVPTRNQDIYLSVMIDHFSSYISVELLSHKSLAVDKHIKPLLLQWQTLLEKRVKFFHTDQGGEYRSTAFKLFLQSQGTTQTFTTAYTPQHNGKAERSMRTLFEMIRSMLFHAGLHLMFWGEAAKAAVYIKNRTTLVRDTKKTPIQLFLGITPSLAHFKVFGCNVFFKVLDSRGKLDPTSKPGFMLGYCDKDPSGIYWRVYALQTNTIQTTRDATFYEKDFSHAKQFAKEMQAISRIRYREHIMMPFGHGQVYEQAVLTAPVQNNEVTVSVLSPSAVLDAEPSSSSIIQLNEDLRGDNVTDDLDFSPNLNHDLSDSDPISLVNSSTEAQSVPSVSTTSNHIPLQGGEIQINQTQTQVLASDPAPVRYKTYEEKFIDHLPLSRSNGGRSTRNTTRTNYTEPQSQAEDDQLLAVADQIWHNSAHYGLALAVAVQKFLSDEPKNYREAISRPDSDSWIQAMRTEMNSITENGTWDLVPLPPGRHTIKLMWVYKRKFNADESIEKDKARLVAKGFTQKYGVDYLETFAPVMKYTSLRILLVIAATYDYELKQFDVHNAFLHAPLSEEIYVDQPLGFVKKGKEHLVCRLKKSLYGLKQAPNEWNSDINNTIVNELRFKRSIFDQCVYVKQSRTNQPMLIGLFVDDLIIVYSKQDEREWLENKAKIESIYKIKDLGDAEWILKMRIIRDRTKRTLTLDQESYINKVINKFNMQDAATKQIPLPSNTQLSKQQSPKSQQETDGMKEIPYLALVGSLIYAVISTRLDVAFATGLGSRYNANPGIAHWKAMKHVLAYLKGTSSSKLNFVPNSGTIGNPHSTPLSVTGYCDSDHAGDRDESKSTTGLIVLIQGCPVYWQSKKQSLVAQSSCEAELLAMATLTKEIIWVREFIQELTLYKHNQPTSLIYCDNESTVQIAKNDSTNGRTKHVAIKYHFIRDHIEKEEVEVKWIPTDQQPADLFTKNLDRTKFHKFRQMFLKD